VFISEESKPIRDFNNSKLLWKQEGLIYGDWYSGPNGDGIYTHDITVPISKVELLC